MRLNSFIDGVRVELTIVILKLDPRSILNVRACIEVVLSFTLLMFDCWFINCHECGEPVKNIES